jgi:hypothetical protein
MPSTGSHLTNYAARYKMGGKHHLSRSALTINTALTLDQQPSLRTPHRRRWSTPYPDAEWGVERGQGDVLGGHRHEEARVPLRFRRSWERTIKVERFADAEPGVLYPRLIEVSGRCPPRHPPSVAVRFP